MNRVIICVVLTLLLVTIMPIDVQAVTSRPTVLISEFSTTPEYLEPGNEFNLDMKLDNVGNRNAYKVMITVNSQAETVGPSDSNQSQTDVLFPTIESGNILYVEKINDGESEYLSLKMFAPGNVKPGVYNITVKVDYSDSGRSQYTLIQTLGVIVSQDRTLEIVSVNYPEDIYIDETAEVSAEFVNVGNAEIYNINARIEGDYKFDEQSMFYGTFLMGDSDIFDTTITPNKKGIINARLVIDYNDRFNQIKSIDKPILINVKEYEEIEVDSDNKDSNGFFSKIGKVFKVLLGIGDK